MLVCAFIITSCHRSPALHPLKLTDGCYYGAGRPILRITGNRGELLVPGAIHRFRVDSSGDDYTASAIFTPGFLFDGVHTVTTQADSPGTREYPMKAGTKVPTIHMYWAAHGDWDLARGPPCDGIRAAA